MHIKRNLSKHLSFWVLSLLLILSMNACANADLESNDQKDRINNFSKLPDRIQDLAKSEKALSILKLEYQINTLPEFVVIRKLQTSILQTYYTAYDIGFLGSCYRSLDFNDKQKLSHYFNLFLSIVEIFNDTSHDTISDIDKNLSINDHYLEKQYPDFSSILLDLKSDIISLRDFINKFVSDNITKEYIAQYPGILNSLVKRKKEDIKLARADYVPPKGFMEHLAQFLGEQGEASDNK
ncbi:MAG: hypothetical protein HQ538_00065 [Parcubacteria group bacterium]|nr:hypothetical protein [Parcubacteria group bacterium]